MGLIDTKSYYFNEAAIPLIEERHNGKYVCETCIKVNGYWRNEPSMIFYSEEAHPEGSNYFAISEQNGAIVISDGISATEPFVGIVADNGEIIYSRFRHDYRTSSDQSVSIDGGRDYTKTVSDKIAPKIVTLQIVKDQVVIV